MPTALIQRGILVLEGDDKLAFLQGLITQDASRLEHQPALYAAMLTPQGRLLHDFFLIKNGAQVLVDCEYDRRLDLLKRLTLYKLRSKVTLRDASDEYQVFFSWGEQNPAVPQGALHITDPRLDALGHRTYLQRGQSLSVTVSLEDYDLHRLALGIPDGSKDMIPEKAIPLECGLDELHAISWTKGCYLGQELTARTKYRGMVRKRLLPVNIEGEVTKGDTLYLADEDVGEMRSFRGSLGLARLKLAVLVKLKENGSPLTTQKGAKLTPFIPEWMNLPAVED